MASCNANQHHQWYLFIYPPPSWRGQRLSEYVIMSSLKMKLPLLGSMTLRFRARFNDYTLSVVGWLVGLALRGQEPGRMK